MPNPSTVAADEEAAQAEAQPQFAAEGFEPSEADSVEPRPTNPSAQEDADLDAADFAELPEALDVVVKESKAGVKTTEFWVTVITAIAVTFNGIPLPESQEGIVLAALAAFYAIARGLAKKGTPHIEPDTAGQVDPVV